jgi:hypothetical protein
MRPESSNCVVPPLAIEPESWRPTWIDWLRRVRLVAAFGFAERDVGGRAAKERKQPQSSSAANSD